MSNCISEWQADRALIHSLALYDPAMLSTPEYWFHYTLENLESIPVAGALVALIELVITAVVGCLFVFVQELGREFDHFAAWLQGAQPPVIPAVPPAPIVPFIDVECTGPVPVGPFLRVQSHAIVWRPVSYQDLQRQPIPLAMITALDAGGRTILFRAIKAVQPNEDLIRWLLENGAPFSDQGRDISRIGVQNIVRNQSNIQSIFDTLFNYAPNSQEIFNTMLAQAKLPQDHPDARIANSVICYFVLSHQESLRQSFEGEAFRPILQLILEYAGPVAISQEDFAQIRAQEEENLR